MMTLAEMADMVCDKVGKTDDESIARCKSYLRRRYNLLHDSNLWRDTLDTFSWSNASMGDEASQGRGYVQQIVGPAWADRILGIRRGDESVLDPDDVIRTFLTAPTAFDDTGDAVRFHRLSNLAVNRFLEYGPGIEDSNDYETWGTRLQLFSNSAADAGKRVRIVDDPTISVVPKSELVTLNGISAVYTDNNYQAPVVLSKEQTTGTVTVYPVTQGNGYFSGVAPVVVLEPKVASISHPRVKLTPATTTAETFLVLAKRKPKQLLEDLDTPTIAGCEEALMAITQADMLEWMRQYGKAQIKAQEAAVMVQKMKDQETNQTANIIRLIPALGGEVGDGGWQNRKINP
jgi:hypothetical protein